MNKLVFFDIDNTIYSSKNDKIMPSVYELFEKLNNENIKIGIATGRPNSNIDCLKDLKKYISYYVLSNGVFVKDKDENIIYENAFSNDEITYLVFLAKKFDVSLGIGTKDIFGLINESSSLCCRKYETKINENIKDRKIHSVWFKTDDIHLLKKIYKNINRHDSMQAFYWNFGGIDVTKKAHSKAFGVKKIVQKKDYLISVGDGENDLELFKISNCKIGMSTSKCKKLLKISDYIASSVLSDDLYYIFKNKLKLIS